MLEDALLADAGSGADGAQVHQSWRRPGTRRCRFAKQDVGSLLHCLEEFTAGFRFALWHCMRSWFNDLCTLRRESDRRLMLLPVTSYARAGRLDPSLEGEAMRWIEGVSLFDESDATR
jgi:hypothetical protein